MREIREVVLFFDSEHVLLDGEHVLVYLFWRICRMMGCTAYMSDDSRRDTRPKRQRVNSAADLAYLQGVYDAVLISVYLDRLVDKL